MPRKCRIEYPGAVYHVINRGNYRKELFLQEGSGKRFVETLFEAVERCGWDLYGYVIMSNHYHLALRTPEPNLVEGMRWLQSVFATRFNRFRKESGHVFQGRYKALLVGDGRLPGLLDYIHLNPVRAGLCSVEDLKGYELSSYAQYWKRRVRSGLNRAVVLSSLGFPDSLAGMRRYERHLAVSEAGDPGREAELMKAYCRGWFLGSELEKKALLKDISERHPDVVWESSEYADLNESRWERLVTESLKQEGKQESDLKSSAKGVDWKARIALKLRKETTAGNTWITKRLNMGHPSRVSNLIREVRG